MYPILLLECQSETGKMWGQIWFDENKTEKKREVLLETGFLDLSCSF